MYRLLPLNQAELGKFTVTIEADSNDADYVTTICKYDKKDFDENVSGELSTLISKFSGRHKLEHCDVDFGYIDIPYNGWSGFCHTLTSVTVIYVDDSGALWNVEIETTKGEMSDDE